MVRPRPFPRIVTILALRADCEILTRTRRQPTADTAAFTPPPPSPTSVPSHACTLPPVSSPSFHRTHSHIPLSVPLSFVPQIARVWALEQEKKHEERKMEEMAKEVAEERKLQDLQMQAAEAGHIDKVERLEFMYKVGCPKLTQG